MYRYPSVLVIALYIGRDIRGSMNFTCVQLGIPSTYFCLSRWLCHTQNLFITTCIVCCLCLLVRLIFQFILLHHILIGPTNTSFSDRLNLNPFICTFSNLNIVVLTWYDITSYSIVLPMSIYPRLIYSLSIYFRCIIYVTT